ncbi:MAG: phosphoribosylglycinamide formyltransferase [Acidimicrobiales bacterium]
MKIAVFASGTGSVFQSIVSSGISVDVVVTDRPCGAEELAESYGISACRVARRDFDGSFDRAAYTDQVVARCRDYSIDLVVLAGFGTVLASSFFEPYGKRVLNTHPSLLPAFPGWHAVRAALEYPVQITGCSVHVVVPEVDAGPLLAQESVRVLPGDDEARLHERIKSMERVLYPKVIRAFADSLERLGEPDQAISEVRRLQLTAE